MQRLPQLVDATGRWSERGIITPKQGQAILEHEVDDLHPLRPGMLAALSAALAGLLLGSFVAATQRDVLGAVLGVSLAAAGFAALSAGSRGLAEAMWTASVGVWAMLFLLLDTPAVEIGVVGLLWVWAGLAVDLSAPTRSVWVLLHGAALVGALGVFGLVHVAALLVVGSLVYVAASWLRTDPADTGRPWLIAAAGTSAVVAGIGSGFSGEGPAAGAWMALAVGLTLLLALLAWAPGAMRRVHVDLPWDA